MPVEARNLTLDTRQLHTVPPDGTLRVIPVGVVQSNPLTFPKPVDLPFIDGAFTGPVSIYPNKYVFEFYDTTPPRGTPLDKWPAVVPDEAGTITVGQLYLQARGETPPPPPHGVYIPLVQKGNPGGVAPLDGDGKVPAEFLPPVGSYLQRVTAHDEDGNPIDVIAADAEGVLNFVYTEIPITE